MKHAAPLTAIIVALALPASAHGPAEWIQRGAYKNTAGELCCGERDCGVQIGGRIEQVRGGYAVDATFQIGEGTASTVYHVKEFVPFDQATPSPDGSYWRCAWGGERKCFFAPPPSS